jgi:uncharacterized protein
MRFARCSISISMFLTLAGVAVAGPYEDATAAYFRKDYATALRILRPLADQGTASAQNSLGAMYAMGEGVPQDYAKAAKWYRKAADRGNSQAQYNLGVAYFKGRGLPQDYAEAVKWTRLAADQGYAGAQYNLGSAYASGQGVPQDLVLAHMWINLAAEQGNQDALKYRDIIAEKMTPEQIAEAQRLAAEWKPKHSPQ